MNRDAKNAKTRTIRQEPTKAAAEAREYGRFMSTSREVGPQCLGVLGVPVR
jgi:hypothetical protein